MVYDVGANRADISCGNPPLLEFANQIGRFQIDGWRFATESPMTDRSDTVAGILRAAQNWRIRYADEHLQLTERFTRVSDDTLRYEFTVEDPTVSTRPWTAAIYWRKSNGEIFEYACHEGNFSLRGMLSALRAEEPANDASTSRQQSRSGR